LYSELNDKNFEIVSVAQDTGGVKAAGPSITAAKPEYTVLIDTQHLVHAPLQHGQRADRRLDQ
jgi:hypothetical protein